MKKSALLIAFFIFATMSILAQDATVTFNVDMRVKTKELKFTPGTSIVYIRGNFNDWSQMTQMTDANNDTIYTVTIDSIYAPAANVRKLHVNDTLYYKFFYTNADTWESDPNNMYIVPSAASTVNAYFDRDSVVTLVANGNINFKIDMSVMREVGIFDPTVDSVQISGSFNGWTTSDPASFLSKNALNPSKWFKNYPFVNANLNEVNNYKYIANIEDTSDIWNDGYERPLSQGGGNRDVIFLGQTTQDVPEVYYDDVLPDYVILGQTDVTIKFRVDMTNALNPTIQPVPFVPATDRLFWICEQPAFVRANNWVDTDQMQVLELMREGTTNIYSGTLTVNDSAWNGFEYRYGFIKGTDSTWTSEPSGFGDFAYRVRYIKQTAPRTFQKPYEAPVDTWTNAETKTDQETSPYTGVRELGTVANTYQLAQNYPNPFNPSTKITFSIPEAGLVTLKVYNALGQEVATLVNEELGANSYEYNFNASKLSSGLYFYTISSGSFTATKKMMLIK
ncbi:MAG TPA: T9SS type A sorting domain-containing protein [Ignavibacteriaceae bacterium]|nr:T9SS type A sorting domain-containing protein [Ignavibacteriaceae bacterium]